MSVPVILDCDTGTDDAVAIMAAALHPDRTADPGAFLRFLEDALG